MSSSFTVQNDPLQEDTIIKITPGTEDLPISGENKQPISCFCSTEKTADSDNKEKEVLLDALNDPPTLRAPNLVISKTFSSLDRYFTKLFHASAATDNNSASINQSIHNILDRFSARKLTAEDIHRVFSTL
ncbi:hypothetical protein [Candidatus Regiella endosymbiont of Tuberolachnus salignus]|uniref:hypothetical protein n=1 Tax=Candidatus Regiella endosymbiont of Tuberolachnus salignus TaxID=3077956 RepID=UPI0030CF208B